MIFRSKPVINTSEDKINNILTRGAEDIFVKESLEKKLKSGKQLRIKLGIDPTSQELHLGHAVVLRKMRDFQSLGHTAVLIIGDFTAMIGDPTGRTNARPPLDRATIKKNMSSYLSQAKSILDVSKAEVHYNSEWLKPLSFERIFELAGLVSVTQMLERNDFKKRLEAHQSIRLHELFYPVLQAYDSVAIKADVEIGGNDQLFNVLAGRELMEKLGSSPQDIITTSLLEGTDGKDKMSKSVGNYIALQAAPNDMYGLIMSIKDELIEKYFLLTTDVSLTEIDGIKNQLAAGANPKDLKMRLAREVVALYHGQSAAKTAEQNFINTFSKGGVPEDMKEAVVVAGTSLVDILLKEEVVASKTEFRRLLDEGAITNTDNNAKISVADAKADQNMTLKVGKRRFIKITVK